ncbi:MAG: Na/Pi cotransporter family protein [Longimicrobiales bacterium]
MAQGPEIQLFPLFMGLLGGLALFLYGLDLLSDALKAVAGSRMKDILSRLTTNRFTAVLTGAFVTAVVQSSSVTTVLVVGFVTANLMTLAQSVGVIMGANIGTTLTAQIIAFNVSRYSLLLVTLGFLVSFAGRREKTRKQGLAVLGLGLVFFGMGIMGEAMTPLRGYPPFVEVMARMESLGLGIFTGAVFTALIQSSAATTGVVIVLSSQGLLSLPAGIALVLGANIGTCITALLAAIGKPREAFRASVVHVLFNVLGVLIWLKFIPQLAELVMWMTPDAEGLSGIDRMAAEVPREIANAHTVFNLVNTLLFLPFVGALARLAVLLVPDLPPSEEDPSRARYLDPELLQTPSLAVDRARLEILNMGERVRTMLTRILPAVFEGEKEDLLAIRALDEAVDVLHGRIIVYLGQLSRAGLREDESRKLVILMEAANDLENIGDVIETNLVTQGMQRLEEGIRISDATQEVLKGFHKTVQKALELALQAVGQQNAEAAQAVVAMKEAVNSLADSATLHEAQRLVADEPRRLEAYSLEVDILKNLKRVYYFSKRMARGVLVGMGGGSPGRGGGTG